MTAEDFIAGRHEQLRIGPYDRPERRLPSDGLGELVAAVERSQGRREAFAAFRDGFVSLNVYPSFYDAVHRALDVELRRFADDLSSDHGGFCPGGEPYDPDEHACFELASALRFELHAAGIRLSIDGNGSGRRGRITSIENDGQQAYVHVFEPGGLTVEPEAALRQAIAHGEQPLGWLEVGEQIDDVGQQAYPPPQNFFARLLRRVFGID
jgi:hypothetical protein